MAPMTLLSLIYNSVVGEHRSGSYHLTLSSKEYYILNLHDPPHFFIATEMVG